jgi:hypothetical protein
MDEQVENVLDQAPETFVFAPDGFLYLLSDLGAALRWRFGPPGRPPRVRRIDISSIARGRIAALQTFLAI